jgi:hypothetical protein
MLMQIVVTLSVIYHECIMSVTIKSIMLSFVMMSVIVLLVVTPTKTEALTGLHSGLTCKYKTRIEVP